MDIYYIDGQFIEEDKATLSAKDITVLRGFGVFDFLITYNKRPFYLEAHVARLENSAKKIGLTLRHTNAEICDIVHRAIGKNPHHDESNIRIVYTGGISPDGVTPRGNGKLMVMVTPKYVLPEWWYTDGAAVITVEMERFIPESKSTNYLSAVFAQQEAHKKGAIEAIYVDRENRVLEGTTTNLFAFKGNTVITPPDAMLPGITRSVVLELIKEKFTLEMRHIDMAELKEMDEIFITASNKEIVPVIKINDMVVADGKPGKKTRQVMALFRDYTTAYGQQRKAS
ncbi:branched-chain amino acid aminotransferase [Desulfocicer vacuolatum DSM 3385]|uniref:branched-chain-amino-acid transaminase n=1 Tax=Desulfocicer vacuolatum DSM 3385 TaxID=1121400 RepID=A0A1W2CG50_9BACT|nr:aminotransferase class IV [Desulfocicer vacuolatum]SMC83934.1 branched-chain amino acid aminotransferase [Desulfocicer vacuolatum DSM 3385]